MSKDIDGDDGTERPMTRSEPRTEGETLTREGWEQLHSDPDDADDLGYRLDEWKDIETLDGSDQVMFLPEDEDAIDDAAFVVVEADTLQDLGEQC